MFDNDNAVNSDYSTACPVRPLLDLSTAVCHSAAMTQTGPRRLAEHVRQRRRQLGLAQADLKSRGGPGVVTVGKIERAEIQQPEPTTLRGLDRALRWHDGDAARVLDGQDPRPRTDAPEVDAREAIRLDPDLTERDRRILLATLDAMKDPAVEAVEAESRAALDREGDDPQPVDDGSRESQPRPVK